MPGEEEKKDSDIVLTNFIRLRGQQKKASPDEKLSQIIESDSFKYKMNELRLIRRYEGRPQDIKVSIIMPTWNRAFIIGRAIESILRQTYENFELIISDDGSTDKTKQYIEENYGDMRIKYIENAHSGASITRNAGLRQSSGQLIGYLDSDDEWSENYLLLMVNAFVDNPDVGTAYCGVKLLNYIEDRKSILFREYDRDALLHRNYIPINGFMHKRSLFEEFGGFDQDLTPLEDWDLILRYTKRYPPFSVECVLATYYLEKDIDHHILADDLLEVYEKVKRVHASK